MPVGIWGWWFKIDDLRSHFFPRKMTGWRLCWVGYWVKKTSCSVVRYTVSIEGVPFLGHTRKFKIDFNLYRKYRPSL